MTRILTDSTSCLSPATGKQAGVVVVPQMVDFGNKVYTDWVDLDPLAFIKKLKEADRPPQSVVAPVDHFAAAMKPLVDAGETIICICPSSAVSKILAVEQEAAGRFGKADIRFIDTRVISSPMASLALLGTEMAGVGYTADEIEKRLREMVPLIHVYFLLDNLDYLARGGRIGGAQALVGNLLQMKPILTFRNGQVDQFDTVRTHRHAMVRIEEFLLQRITRDSHNHLTVMHAGAPEAGEALANDLKWKLSLRDVPVYHIPPTVASHAGPGTLGIAFFVEPYE